MENTIHVLVIDNDPSVSKGLIRLFGNAGYRVSHCNSLNEFMDALKPDLSGCIVLDSQITWLSGKDIHAVFMNHGICLPVIIISADNDSKTRQKAHEMSAAGLFLKPIDGNALIDAINWAVQSQKEKRDPYDPR
jgi:FixJ family two-component response regulator